MKKAITIFSAITTIVLTSGCTSLTTFERSSEQLINFNGVSLTIDDIQNELGFFVDEGQKLSSVSDEQLVQIVGAMVVRKRVARYAIDQQKLLEDERVKLQLARERERILFELAQQRHAKELNMNDLERDALNYYLENKQDFTKQPQRVIQEIFREANDPQTIRKQRAFLFELRTKILAGEVTFGDAALRHSNAISRITKGDSGIESVGSRSDIEEVALADLSDDSQISNIVETPNGLYLFKVLERQDEYQVPFETVKERIIEQLATKKIKQSKQKWFDELLIGWDDVFTSEFFDGVRARLD